MSFQIIYFSSPIRMIIGNEKNVFTENLSFSQKTFPGIPKKIIRVLVMKLVMKLALQINTHIYEPLLYEFIYYFNEM